MPAQTDGLVVDRQSGRCRISCRDGTLVYFYRAVVEADLGRHLLPDEQVHHINGDQTDDHLENLALISAQEHGAIHGREAWLERKAGWISDWSEHFAWCLICGTTERPHAGFGQCLRCYSRIRSRAARLREQVAL